VGIISAAVKHMMAAGMPPEVIIDAIADMENGRQVDEQAERRRAADRERKREARLRKSAESADKAEVPRGGVTRVEGLTSNSEIEPLEENKKRATSALSAEFDTTFWPAFPNKTGKPKALSAFLAARRKAELTAIMAGLRRYVASKPPDRPWLNPATFLNQERWMDEPAFTARAGPAPRSNPLADAFGSMRPPDERHPPPTDDTVLYLPAAAR
jgi:hypothetical protein